MDDVRKSAWLDPTLDSRVRYTPAVIRATLPSHSVREVIQLSTRLPKAAQTQSVIEYSIVHLWPIASSICHTTSQTLLCLALRETFILWFNHHESAQKTS